MKTIKYILALAILANFAFGCKNEVKPEVKTVEVEIKETKELDPNATYAKAEFTIDGMTCAVGCAAKIQKEISKMDGVKAATVDFDKKLAMVEFDEAQVNPVLLTKTVTGVSETYKVSDMKTVDAFSSEKTCSPDCKKACCANKSAEEKATCSKDCKKACCTKKKAA